MGSPRIRCEEKATSALASSSLPPRRKERLVLQPTMQSFLPMRRGSILALTGGETITFTTTRSTTQMSFWNNGQQCSSFLLHGWSSFHHHISNVATYGLGLQNNSFHICRKSSPPILK